MRVNFKKYFDNDQGAFNSIVRSFVIVVLVFSVVFFLWSIMRYNSIQEQKKDKEKYISVLNEKIDELEYLNDMPLDDEYKIRIARERLGMCFPDEIIFYTDID